jgi:hypothetical protein
MKKIQFYDNCKIMCRKLLKNLKLYVDRIICH